MNYDLEVNYEFNENEDTTVLEVTNLLTGEVQHLAALVNWDINL